MYSCKSNSRALWCLGIGCLEVVLNKILVSAKRCKASTSLRTLKYVLRVRKRELGDFLIMDNSLKWASETNHKVLGNLSATGSIVDNCGCLMDLSCIGYLFCCCIASTL